ncbi:MAG: branched-chain amino acid ABC transporter substrate-binding protein [Proteobacteria bacterium]|nr:MAG: branched-chain amino acid ABC transporter substrate-binding protein [Pseudomonadota bacterium]
MKKLLLAALIAGLAQTASAEETIKIGFLQGFTGPIESLTPMMAASAEIALEEVNASGALLGGKATLEAVRADSTCVDAAAATAAAERLVTSEKVAAIYGASCSGATTAVVNNVSVPNGVLTVSPSATSPALTMLEDKDFFFRTAPSDARQGELLAEITKKDRGIDTVAITYTNNDYGKGLSDAFSKAYKALGGKIVINTSHEDGKADYSAEVASLSAAGADTLVVFGYVDQGGKGIVQTALDTGAFDQFVFADGMVGESLLAALGDALDGTFGTTPGGESAGTEKWMSLAKENDVDGAGGPYRGESYDAVALIALAIQAAGSADRAAIQSKIMEVANAPGEKVLPGELAKGLKIIAEGGDVDYVGATNIEFNEKGDVPGSYREIEVKDAKFETVKLH